MITGTSGTLASDNNFKVTSNISVAQGIKSFGFYCAHNTKEIMAVYKCQVAPMMGQWETRAQPGMYGSETLIFVPFRFFSQNASISFTASDI